MSSCLQLTEVTFGSLVSKYESGTLISTRIGIDDVPEVLATSLKNIGQQQPIMVAVINNTWVVLDGWKRFLSLYNMAKKEGKLKDPLVMASKVQVLINRCISSLEEARMVGMVVNTIRKSEKHPEQCRDLALAVEKAIGNKPLTPEQLRSLWCEPCAAILNYVVTSNEQQAERLILSLGAKESQVQDYVNACREWKDAFLRISARNAGIAFMAATLLHNYRDKYPKLIEELFTELSEEQSRQRAQQQQQGVPSSVEEVVTEEDRKQAEELAKESEEQRRARRQVRRQEQQKSEEELRIEAEVAFEYGYPMPKQVVEEEAPSLNDAIAELIEYGDVAIVKKLFERNRGEVESSIRDVCENYLVSQFESLDTCVERLSAFADSAYERAVRSRYSGSTWARLIEKLKPLSKRIRISQDGSISFKMHPLVFMITVLVSSPDTVDSIVKSFWHWVDVARDLSAKGLIRSSTEAEKYIYSGLFASLYHLRHLIYKYSNVQLPKELADEIESLANMLGIDAPSVVEYALTLLRATAMRLNGDAVKLFQTVMKENEYLMKHVTY